ncbi:NAD(P)/FAD-dependent oxidoreductase [Tautonia rosea]|uniref:NAD(P)/FAD-dependent oxidoreductase n=1 Tax=Tautonia rosea TaxID=2728037 RepID=UPI001473916D|nr:FAD-dependent oxidoreductase [Tautonia rosea]
MPKRFGIIGAGIAGLTAARRLRECGHSVVVLDKGRRPGGRASTRSMDGLSFDHGPPWFSITDPTFQTFLEASGASSCLDVWQGRFARFESGLLIPELPESPRFVGVPGMGTIGQRLAEGIDVRMSVHVDRIEQSADSWTIIARDGSSFGTFDAVIVTAPPAQAAALLREHSSLAATLESIPMAVCFAWMTTPEDGTVLPFDGIRCDHPVLRWASNEQSKPGRPESPALVLQANHAWSEAHRDRDPSEVARFLRAAAEETFAILLGPPRVESLHRWLFAQPVDPLGTPCLIDPEAHLAACGDWALLGSIEGAFQSGFACAQALIESFP